MMGTEINRPHAAPAEWRCTLDADPTARHRHSDRETADPRVVPFPAEQRQLDQDFGFAPSRQAGAITQYL